MIMALLVVIMYFYISKLQDENKALELSNSSLSVTLEAQHEEFLKNQKTISDLNSKLNLLRAKSRNEEDKLNEAISKSNLIHYISSIQCVGKDVVTTISFDSVKHCETEEEAKEFVKQICELRKNIKKENK